MIDYQKILMLCEAATPGPWRHVMVTDDDGEEYSTPFLARRFVEPIGCALWQSEADQCNADYIAAVPPDVVKELIEENMRLRAWAQRIAKSWLECGIEADALGIKLEDYI